MDFPVVLYEYEIWALKKAENEIINTFKFWCWRRLLRVPWTEGDQINPQVNQHWIFIGSTYAKAEAPVLWPPEANSWVIAKEPDTGGNWGQEEEAAIEDELVEWHHQLRTGIWVNSGGEWRTGKPGMLQSMELQRAKHDLEIDQKVWGGTLFWFWFWFPWGLIMLSTFPMYLLAICMSSWTKRLIHLFWPLFIYLFIFYPFSWLLSYMNYLYIFYFNILSPMLFAHIFSLTGGCFFVFVLLIVLSLLWSIYFEVIPLVQFWFWFPCLRRQKKYC